MLHKTPDKFINIQCNLFGEHTCFMVFAPERDPAIVARAYPVIGDGYPVRIFPKVFDYLAHTTERFFSINIPGGFIELDFELLKAAAFIREFESVIHNCPLNQATQYSPE